MQHKKGSVLQYAALFYTEKSAVVRAAENTHFFHGFFLHRVGNQVHDIRHAFSRRIVIGNRFRSSTVDIGKNIHLADAIGNTNGTLTVSEITFRRLISSFGLDL